MANNYNKVLIVEDDIDLSMLICDMLEDNGCEYFKAKTLDEAYKIIENEKIHLILLDINLPDGEGFDFCKEIRKVSEVPVIFVSARTTENDRITGLDIGGDDYISKPYSIKELMSRINSLLRRTYGLNNKQEVYELKAGKDNIINIDTSKRRVLKNGKEVALSLKEYDLLIYLCEHKSHAVTKNELVNSIWGAFSEVEPSTLTVHIRWLREKLEKDPSNPTFIKTVWGVGYTLEESDS